MSDLARIESTEGLKPVTRLKDGDPEYANAVSWGTKLAQDLDYSIFGSPRSLSGQPIPLCKQRNCVTGQLEADLTFILRRHGCLLKSPPQVPFCTVPVLEEILGEALEALPNFPIWLEDRAVEVRYRLGIDAMRRQVQVLLIKVPNPERIAREQRSQELLQKFVERANGSQNSEGQSRA